MRRKRLVVLEKKEVFGKWWGMAEQEANLWELPVGGAIWTTKENNNIGL